MADWIADTWFQYHSAGNCAVNQVSGRSSRAGVDGESRARGHRQVMSVDYLLIYTRRSTSVLILYYSFRHNANELAKYRERHSTDNAPCSRSTVELFYYPFSIAISYFKCHLFDGEAAGSIWSNIYCCYLDDVTAMPSSEARFGNFTIDTSTYSQQFIHRQM